MIIRTQQKNSLYNAYQQKRNEFQMQSYCKSHSFLTIKNRRLTTSSIRWNKHSLIRNNTNFINLCAFTSVVNKNRWMRLCPLERGDLMGAPLIRLNRKVISENSSGALCDKAPIKTKTLGAGITHMAVLTGEKVPFCIRISCICTSRIRACVENVENKWKTLIVETSNSRISVLLFLK